MLGTTKISIIIPSFNCSKTIGRTLDSIMAQTYSNWECLLVDDGSTDGSQTILEEWAAKEARIQFHQRPADRKKGANACRNIGIEKSSGDYLMFLDSDDSIFADCFEKRIGFFEKNNEADALVFSGQEKRGEEVGGLINNDPQKQDSISYLKMFLSYEIPWHTTSPIWKRNVLKKTNRFDENLKRFQDVDFHTAMLLSGCEVKRIHETDFFYHTDDAHDKFHDEVFIAKALAAIRYYLKKYDGGKIKGVLSAKERRPFLRQMFLKALKRFVYDRNRKKEFRHFTRLAWNTKIFSRKECLYLSMLRRVDAYQLQNKAGFGFYRLNKFLLSRIFPSK